MLEHMLYMYICMWGSAIIIVFAVINACFLSAWPVAKKKNPNYFLNEIENYMKIMEVMQARN